MNFAGNFRRAFENVNMSHSLRLAVNTSGQCRHFLELPRLGRLGLSFKSESLTKEIVPFGTFNGELEMKVTVL